MSTRGIGFLCFAFAAVLFLIAAVSVFGGTHLYGPPAFRAVFPVVICIAPFIVVLAGVYLLREKPTQYF
jgi:hypothetical protein